jgi:hypothetical protein
MSTLKPRDADQAPIPFSFFHHPYRWFTSYHLCLRQSPTGFDTDTTGKWFPTCVSSATLRRTRTRVYWLISLVENMPSLRRKHLSTYGRRRTPRISTLALLRKCRPSLFRPVIEPRLVRRLRRKYLRRTVRGFQISDRNGNKQASKNTRRGWMSGKSRSAA